jgi:hypothetical protein
MKVQIGKLVESFTALKELSEVSLPAATSMKVALVMSEAMQPMKAFEDAYNRLLREVGTPQADKPGTFDIKDQERFMQETNELFAQEIELSLEEKLTNLGSASIKPATLLALSWLVKV